MRHAITACFVPWEIGAAFWQAGPHPWIAGAVAVLAVFSIMSLTEVARA